jgi:hypothetical protein
VPYVADHPVFLANYRLEKVTGPEGFTVKLYVHRDMALPEDGG